MKVTKNGKYFGIFMVTCGACGCEYEVRGPEDFIFSNASDDVAIYAGDKLVSTSHCAYAKCPECSFKQKFT